MYALNKLVARSAVIVAMGILSLPVSSPADTLSLRADIWCPYNCEAGSEKPGYMIEIAQEIAKIYGHTIDYQQLSWARALAETRAGKFVGVIGAAKTDADDFIFPDQPFGVSREAYITKKNFDFNYNGIASLEAKSIAVIQDYSYADELNDYIEKNSSDFKKVQVAAGDNALESNLKKLEAGRVDIVIEDLNVFLLKAKQLGKENSFNKETPENSLEIYFAFSPKNKKSAQYAKEFSEGLTKLRETGKLADIMNRYGLQDWQKK